MKEIEQKHVVIGMSNGTILEGFVLFIEDDFLDLIENNNIKVKVRISDISFARISTNTDVPEPVKKTYPVIIEDEKPQRPSNNEFSMSMPSPQEDQAYRPQLEFVKRSRR